LVERFAQIDAALVRQEMEKHQEEWRDLPKGLKNILKIPDLPQKSQTTPIGRGLKESP
jgi:hypothetical protein